MTIKGLPPTEREIAEFTELSLQDERDWYARHGGYTFIVALTGEKKGGRKDYIPGGSVPDGCQWSRSCLECEWSDCRLGADNTRVAYDSPKAARLRGIARVRPARIRAELMPSGFAGARLRRDAALADMFDSGKTTLETAKHYGVSYRMTQRAVVKRHGILHPGMQRRRGRRKVAVVPVTVGRALPYLVVKHA